MNKKNIILFGGGLQVLSISRSLNEVGYKVYVVGTHNEIFKFSRYVEQCEKVDILTLTLSSLIIILNKRSYGVIIPMEDEYAEWLSKNRVEIEEQTGVKCAVMPYEIYSLASDKSKLIEFCRQHNIPHPKTALITNCNFDSVSSYVGFPALIKPSKSAGSRGICMVKSNDEFKALAKMIISKYGESSLQEYIGDKDYYYNVMLYRTLAGGWGNHVITKIIRYYPINGGSSSFCYTIDNEKLVSICKKLLIELNWFGFADFDVLEKGDGDYRIIEINPRIPASVRAAAISGVNFGEMIVSDILGLGIPKYEYKLGMQLRCLGLDIAWFISSPKRMTSKPSWFRFISKKLYYQEGGIKDVFAMIASLFIGFIKILSPSFRKSKSGMN